MRARSIFSNIGAQFMTVAGGEVAGYTRLLTDSRNQARERMWREARARGANAVVAMRFDCNEIGDLMSEVAAYGTAVTVTPDPAAPRPATPHDSASALNSPEASAGHPAARSQAGLFGVLPRSAAGMTGWCDLFEQVIPPLLAGAGGLVRGSGQVRIWLCARLA